MSKLLFLITEDWFFCSHFLMRAIAAREAGFDVVVAAREQQHGEIIRSAGLRFVPLPFDRRSMNPMRELGQLAMIWQLYRHERPDIVHHIAVKPILYGTLAARLAGVRAIINAPVGLGYVFSSEDRAARWLRPVFRLAYRLLMNPPGSRVIFENRDDLASFVAQGVVRKTDAVLIRGAGVDVTRFHPSLVEKGQPPIVMLVARMLRDKGIVEFVAAARLLKKSGVAARFVLVGDPDPENPASLDVATLNAWHEGQVVEWWGRREDMPEVFAQADIVCLPSYREGLPKVLLEAAASACARVATDVPGCREAVIDGEDGLLVPPRDVLSLAAALRRLLDDEPLRIALARRGRERVEQEFSDDIVVQQTMAVYREIMADGVLK